MSEEEEEIYGGFKLADIAKLQLEFNKIYNKRLEKLESIISQEKEGNTVTCWMCEKTFPNFEILYHRKLNIKEDKFDEFPLCQKCKKKMITFFKGEL